MSAERLFQLLERYNLHRYDTTIEGQTCKAWFILDEPATEKRGAPVVVGSPIGYVTYLEAKKACARLIWEDLEGATPARYDPNITIIERGQ